MSAVRTTSKIVTRIASFWLLAPWPVPANSDSSNMGGGNSNPHLDNRIRVLDFLSGRERSDLLEFLRSLAGELPPDVGPPDDVKRVEDSRGRGIVDAGPTRSGYVGCTRPFLAFIPVTPLKRKRRRSM